MDATDPTPGAAAPLDPASLPAPVVRPPRRARVPLVWLVPAIAALAGLVLIVRTYLRTGPSISIAFETAEGLEAGKTEVKYKNVVVGRVKNIALSLDRKQVLCTVELTADAASIAVEDTRFWVERPRVGLGGISGISTLLSGAYIGVDIGTSKRRKRHFVGLEKPPAITRDKRGRQFVLTTSDAGSLSIGSPVYYRRILAGAIASLDLAPDGKHVILKVFVDAPYDQYVRRNTRFWNASGIDLQLNAEGLKVDTQSLATVLVGGVAFEVPPDQDAGPIAPENSRFELYSERARALAKPDQAPVATHMRFFQSTRGLKVGAPVYLLGFRVGTVKKIELDYDPERQEFHTDVLAQIYPARLGPAYRSMEAGRGAIHTLQKLVGRGLRAQLRIGNLLTGQAYIALDFFKNPAPVTVVQEPGVLRIPSEPGSLEQLQQQITTVVSKLDTIPFEDIGKNLRDTLKGTRELVRRLDGDVALEAKKALAQLRATLSSLDENLVSPDAPLQSSARTALEQIERAAKSLRALTDFLERHPDALIRGKLKDSVPDPNKDSTPTKDKKKAK